MTVNARPEDRELALAPLNGKVDHVRGAPAGRLIIEYGDYECPYSRQTFHAIEQVERQLGGNVRFAFRHFPLTGIHPHVPAAAAAVHRLVPAVHAELGVQMVQVGADGVHREEQLTGDLRPGAVGWQVAQDTGLAVGELFIQAPPAGRAGQDRPTGSSPARITEYSLYVLIALVVLLAAYIAWHALRRRSPATPTREQATKPLRDS